MSLSLTSSSLSLFLSLFLSFFSLQVREARTDQVKNNAEIQNIVKIMGLRFGTEYNESTISKLRYGHIMIMTDQDQDGSHIKGLLLNFLHHFWPSLLQVPGFVQVFITPIVKATCKVRFSLVLSCLDLTWFFFFFFF